MAIFSRFFSRKPQSSGTPDRRLQGIEPMEPRCVLSADPIDLGVVYVEQDSGSDVHGDLFELTWQGGAENTQLTKVTIDGDQDINGFSVGDVFFDVASDGFGADASSEFVLGKHEGIDEIRVTVDDGGTLLTLEFEGFDPGERLLFEIDVDEVEDYETSYTDLDYINEGFDPITSGVEFQGSWLTAEFAAPRYHDLTDTAEFRNRYDDTLTESGLDLPADDENGQRDRSAGAFLVGIQQQPLPASLSGYVYHDRNNDGLIDSGEEGISDVLLTLLDSAGTVVDVQLTDSEGAYAFLELAAGTYSIEETHPLNWTDGLETAGTIDNIVVGAAMNPGDSIEQITIAPGDEGVQYNFGEFYGAAIRGRVQESTREGDCFSESIDHTPIPGATVQLLDASGEVIEETVTDENGAYAFEGLPPGEYGLREITPDEYLDGSSQAGNVDGDGRGAVDTSGTITGIQLGSGEEGEDFLFCEHKPAILGGTVFHDRSDDGVIDPDEEGIAGVEVQLIDEDGNVVQTAVTDENGNYEFTGITPGTYCVREVQPDDWYDGKDAVGDIGGETAGNLDPAGDKIGQIEIGWGDVGTDYDFGELQPGSISGRVHLDLIRDCTYDPEEGEELLPDVTVELIDQDGNVVATETTDASGEYRFDSVPPGTYAIREIQPADLFDTGSKLGSGGGTIESDNMFTGVTVGSGDQLTDYDFCEQPPVALSGYVFQDGPPVDLEQGETLPERVADVRPGIRSSDDSYLSGVVLELRDGVTGAPLSPSEFALDGYYSGDLITTETDADGYYEFAGILGGSYSVYQRQPEGYTDGVDTPGSLDGYVFNPGEAQQESIYQALEVDPQNDGIVRINIAPGQQAVENNFSEILVNELPPTPTVDPPPFRITPTKIPPPVGPPLGYSNGNPQPSAPGGGSYSPPGGGGGSGAQKPRSWHLSVINGGQPRNEQDPGIEDSIWLANGGIYDAQSLHHGAWTIGTQYGNQTTTGNTQFLFGLPNAIAISGDFNGDGFDEIGIYAKGEWFIDLNGNGKWDSEDLWAKLGKISDYPVTGDWDGDGKTDIGIYGRQWQDDDVAIAAEPGLPDEDNRTHNELKNVPPDEEDAVERQRILRRGKAAELRSDVIDHTFRFGRKADTPVTGDWNGDGITTIGVFRDGMWRLDVDGNGRWNKRDQTHQFGRAGDTPLVGDCDGDGVDDLAVLRNGVVIIDDNGNGKIDGSDRRIHLGDDFHYGDQPVVGDFDGDGIDEIAVYRAGTNPEPVIYQARRAG